MSKYAVVLKNGVLAENLGMYETKFLVNFPEKASVLKSPANLLNVFLKLN